MWCNIGHVTPYNRNLGRPDERLAREGEERLGVALRYAWISGQDVPRSLLSGKGLRYHTVDFDPFIKSQLASRN